MKPILWALSVCALLPGLALAADCRRCAPDLTPPPVNKADPGEQIKTIQAWGSTYADAVRAAHASAKLWTALEGVSTYRVLSQTVRQVGDTYECALTIAYYFRCIR
jgi:hypothetical protein